MIFWATVLSFIVGLMYFMMYPRSDKIDTVDRPASEAFVANFVSQHQAARQYAREILLALSKVSGSTHESTDTEAQKKLFILPVFFEDFIPNIQLTETAYKLDPSAYCPAGSSCGGYTSVLACLDRKDGFYSDGTRITGKLVDCVTSPAKIRYIMTYGYVPEADINVFKNKNILWESAILRRTSGSPDCGFVYQTNPNIGVAGEFRISNSQKITRKIPQAVSDALAQIIQRAPQDTHSDSKKWMMFCLSPANEPYVTNGLVLHYDSFMNALSPTLHHSKETTEWANLVDGSNNFAQISGGPKEWNPYRESSLFFDGSRSVNTQIDQSTFGNFFTISYVARYDTPSGSYGTFGGGTTEPRLMGGIFNGSNLLFGIKGKSDTLSVPIKPFETIQVTYSVDQQNHSVYINGELKANSKFPIFTRLSPASFIIGQSPADTFTKMQGNIYNFKVYDRVLNQAEIEKNFKTDRKRFNF